MNIAVRKTLRLFDQATSLGGKAPATVTRFLRYAVSSSSTVFLDLLILAFLTEFLNVFYLLSVVVSFTTSNTVNYIINRKWGFRETKTNVARGYFLFLFFGTVGLGITVLLMWLFVSKMGANYLIARIVVAMIEGTIGFILNSIFTFKIPLKD
jgi:putative flippase GtrA